MLSVADVVVPEQRVSPEGRPEPAAIPAFDLLQHCERRWSTDLGAALHSDGSIDARHRRRLVAQALVAYDRLRAAEAPDADDLAVFRRWPSCTVVGLVGAVGERANGRTAADQLEEFLGDECGRWLRGWVEAWRRLASSNAPELVQEVPGLVDMLAAARVIGLAAGDPMLRFEFSAGLLVIEFPGASCQTWQVAAGDRTDRVLGARWSLRGPVGEIVCRDATGAERVMAVVDPSDPLLLFDGDGAVLPPGAVLSPGAVWMLHPGEPTTNGFRGDWRILEVASPPLGWRGWWLGKLELGPGTAVRGHTAGVAGPWRKVLDETVAAFHLNDPIPGLVDLSGNPVCADVPRLVLPAVHGEPWQIVIRREGAGGWSLRHTAGGGQVLDLADLLPRPALGRFSAWARHREHRTMSVAFTVAAGVAVNARVRARMLSKGGLRPADVTIRTSEGMRVDRSVIRLTTSQTARPVELSTPDDALILRVELPYADMRKRIGGEPGQWAIKPITFDLDELRAGAHLDLRLPAVVREACRVVPDLVAGDDPDAPVQRVRGQRVAGLLRYNLSALVDTAYTVGDLALWLDLPGDQRAQVATVEGPTRAPSATREDCARLGDGSLHLPDGLRGGRRSVTVRAGYAPWLAPFRGEIAAGRCTLQLPEPFRDGGPLIVTVVPEDAPEPRGWPDPGKVQVPVEFVRVGDERQAPVLRDPIEQAIALYLAGRGPLPPAIEALHLLWIVAARALAVLGPGLGAATAQECAAVLFDTPDASLRALNLAGLTDGELVGPLVRSGLAAHSFRGVSDPGSVRALWSSAPLPALLLTSPLLPYLSDDPAWDRAELEPDEERLLAELARRCDPLALDLLAGASAPSQEQQIRLRADIRERFDQQPRGLGSELPALAEYIPLLEQFADHPTYGQLMKTAWARFTCGDSRADNALAAAMSLGFALIARIAAQGDQRAATLEQQTRHAWIALADCAPDLVAADIMLAEFLVSGWRGPDALAPRPATTPPVGRTAS